MSSIKPEDKLRLVAFLEEFKDLLERHEVELEIAEESDGYYCQATGIDVCFSSQYDTTGCGYFEHEIHSSLDASSVDVELRDLK